MIMITAGFLISFLKLTSLFLRIQTSVGWEVLGDLFTRCTNHCRTDPSGGAGIMADLKSFRARDVHGMAVVTSLVVQNVRVPS